MKIKGLLSRTFACTTMMAVAVGFTATSCDSILDEDDVDCSVEYRVKFKYDYNMKYADAFSREVSSVALYAFDDNGKLVYQKTEAGDALAADGYSMVVDMEPGDYHLITWAGLSDEASFSVPLITQGVSSLEELQCKQQAFFFVAWRGYQTVVYPRGNPTSGDCSFGEEHQYHPRYPPANGRGNGRCR